MKKMIVASTSTLHGQDTLEYLKEELSILFKNAKKILFIPYARPNGISHKHYTNAVGVALLSIGKPVDGIHDFDNPTEAIQKAEAIFVGGGNTFLLVKTLHDLNLLSVLREKIEEGTPYLGTSAGSNICGVTMQTSNDMPIVYPPSFETLGILPFNINPHYQDPDPNSTFMGETRETRIQEYLTQNDTTVIGLREGSWLDVEDENIILKGPYAARIFQKEKPPFELESGLLLNFN
ncbi:dipeptidase PepE [Spongiivirga citrea]|uniref:Dipeptidase PepE n=1 Tax=Spongiivirga citrea TaxID=1481457 RepID=A0A6M0CY36_9FLAO|nr:dipeptidase PepE [Spongiivirga citrea]NER18610.1 dipeptidase PepE [Spongiivirga citrea]